MNARCGKMSTLKRIRSILSFLLMELCDPGMTIYYFDSLWERGKFDASMRNGVHRNLWEICISCEKTKFLCMQGNKALLCNLKLDHLVIGNEWWKIISHSKFSYPFNWGLPIWSEHNRGTTYKAWPDLFHILKFLRWTSKSNLSLIKNMNRLTLEGRI